MDSAKSCWIMFVVNRLKADKIIYTMIVITLLNQLTKCELWIHIERPVMKLRNIQLPKHK